MIANGSSQTPPSRLDDATIDAVREALREYLATASSSALQAALLRMASEAREKAMFPENVLVALKDTWSRLPEVRALTDPIEQSRMLHRVVTMCIQEYYSV
jgi:hypothetical protein